MIATDHRMAHLVVDEKAFLEMREELLRKYGSGHAVIQAGKLFNVYRTADEAFAAAIKTFGSKAPFFIRDLMGRAPAEAPALVFGLIDSKIP